jgi:adenylate cyclase
MRFRIGINLGDVMIDGSDIYGDGVNIAARLQELSEPGGILISGPVYDQVYNKLSVGFDYLGQQQVRNVTAPVMSYRVTLGGATFGQTESKDGVKPAPRTARGTAHAGGAPSPHDNAGSMTSVRGPSGRLADLPRPLRAAIVISVFLFLINLFSGLHEIWFHWPAMSILFVVILWMGLRRNLVPDRAEKRRRSRD